MRTARGHKGTNGNRRGRAARGDTGGGPRYARHSRTGRNETGGILTEKLARSRRGTGVGDGARRVRSSRGDKGIDRDGRGRAPRGDNGGRTGDGRYPAAAAG